jgi:molybdopterin-guanine dinucleotide biosynthesis adapter protein
MTQPEEASTVPLPRIISVTGLKKSGKTTVVEALLSELRSRGKRVSSIKKTEHGSLSLDPADTDTRRHADAGAEVVVALLEGEMVRFERVSTPPSFRSIVSLFPQGTDFLVCEGIVDPAAPQAVIVCLRARGDWDETLRVRNVAEGCVCAVSGVVAAGTASGETMGPDGIPMCDVEDPGQRSALADLAMKKACPDVES